MDDIKPVIGWCVVCNGFRLEVGCGCVDCSNHLMATESALAQAREEGRREGMREAAEICEKEGWKLGIPLHHSEPLIAAIKEQSHG